jgi:dienelactone hydrolase
MVVLHHCGGRSKDILAWAAWLRDEGYVALAVDSFSPRGTRNVCATLANPTTTEFAQDAAGALAYLRSQPFVDPKRVGVIGWSYGAGAALITARAAYDWMFDSGSGGFRAAIAFYPGCGLIGADTNIPLLLLLGAADDWTPPGHCVAVAQQIQERKQPIEWMVYPGATHALDQSEYGYAARQYLGHTMQYNAQAAGDAQRRVRAFLREQLR